MAFVSEMESHSVSSMYPQLQNQKHEVSSFMRIFINPIISVEVVYRDPVSYTECSKAPQMHNHSY